MIIAFSASTSSGSSSTPSLMVRMDTLFRGFLPVLCGKTSHFHGL